MGVRPHYLTPSQTLAGTALQNLSTTSVADALKYFSGVQIKDYGGLGGLKTVNVRSLGSQHVGVYLDGIRITNAQNGQIDLGRYSLSNMESVALYNANRNERLQSASEYASAATVYLQTRRPDSTALSVEYGTGSFGLQKLKAYFSFKNILFVDAEYQRTDGDYPFRFQSASEDTVGNDATPTSVSTASRRRASTRASRRTPTITVQSADCPVRLCADSPTSGTLPTASGTATSSCSRHTATHGTASR